MVYQIVDRCHVGESVYHVVRYVISRLRHGRQTWDELPRGTRLAIVRDIVKRHRANRKLYLFVMRGVK